MTSDCRGSRPGHQANPGSLTSPLGDTSPPPLCETEIQTPTVQSGSLHRDVTCLVPYPHTVSFPSTLAASSSSFSSPSPLHLLLCNPSPDHILSRSAEASTSCYISHSCPSGNKFLLYLPAKCSFQLDSPAPAPGKRGPLILSLAPSTKCAHSQRSGTLPKVFIGQLVCGHWKYGGMQQPTQALHWPFMI